MKEVEMKQRGLVASELNIKISGDESGICIHQDGEEVFILPDNVAQFVKLILEIHKSTGYPIKT